MSGPIANYHFTLKAEGYDHQMVIDALEQWAKKWVFQLEDEKGYLHFQGRISLIKKRRLGELIKAFTELPGIHWSIESNNGGVEENFYCCKADSRIDGPWRNDDEVKVLTRQLKYFNTCTPYEWQQEIIGLAQGVDDRSIKLIYDQHGNNGKSILAEYMEYQGIAYEIPPFRAMEDLMQCVMGVKTYPCYIVDMPRGMKKEKLSEFYAGLECIKNGTAYDKRYAFKKKRFDRPQVIVFTNVLPVMDLLSKDRWEIYEMTEEKSLRRQACNTRRDSFFL